MPEGFYNEIPKWDTDTELIEENISPEELKKMGVELGEPAMTIRDASDRVVRYIEHFSGGSKKIDTEYNTETGNPTHMIFFDQKGNRVREGFFDSKTGMLTHWMEYNPDGTFQRHDNRAPHPAFLERMLKNQPWGSENKS